ncbi:MAG: sugar phosphate isomerase/epimerase family protein [Pirellulaceae bacterium]
MKLWPHGVVTNCFKWYLDQGEGLASICQRCEQMGLRYIELRQFSLDCDPRELNDNDLQNHFLNVRESCESIEFDYAIDIPFLSGNLDSAAADINDAVLIANAIAGNDRPHIRIVDTTTTPQSAREHAADSVASLVSLANHLSGLGICLSIEHAKQNWQTFWEVFSNACQLCGDGVLSLCFDPANFALAEELHLLPDVQATLPVDVISMFHVKQSDGPRITTSLEAGDIQWRDQFQYLSDKGYERALMFEMTTSSRIWAELESAMSQWRGYMS